MKVLVVCSFNNGRIAPFIQEQVDSLIQIGIEIEYFKVIGKGVLGYLRNLPKLIQHINSFRPDIVHAHYGISGILANLQRKVPVVTTYHGSDINDPEIFTISKVCFRLSVHNIVVNESHRIKIAPLTSKKVSVIPCGVDTSIFRPIDKLEARKYFGFRNDEKLILFSGAFDNKVKNAALAIQAVEIIPGARLLELKGYSRSEVALLMNAVDVCLMTSHSEGSPQFIKEAMACNCKIVSVDVGDVKENTASYQGCWIVPYESNEINKSIKLGFEFMQPIQANHLSITDINEVASSIRGIFMQIILRNV